VNGNGLRDKSLATAALFASLSTLLCCALPALLVALGAGAVMAQLVSTVPQLTIVSRHKTVVFLFAGTMLLVSGCLRWRNRFAPCPADPLQAQACMRLRRMSATVFWISLAAYLTGGFFAFIAPRLL
jgi:hypothetical protein